MKLFLCVFDDIRFYSSNQTVAGLKLGTRTLEYIGRVCSNQTVAGLKQKKFFIDGRFCYPFKSDRCGIETESGMDDLAGRQRSNQTVAGLKPVLASVFSHDFSRSNQTVAGLKQRWGARSRMQMAPFKSDRCGIETYHRSNQRMWILLGSNQTVAGLKRNRPRVCVANDHVQIRPLRD